MAIDKGALLQKRLKQREVEIPDMGTVTVRSLSRAEAQKVHGVGMDPGELERKMIAIAMVEPTMTEDEVGTWQEAADVGELSLVVNAIIEMSGMEVATPKEVMQQFRDGS